MNKFCIQMLAMSMMAIALSANSIEIKPRSELTVVTWNIEHLAEDNLAGCKPRTAVNYEQLKRYALSLNADIVALQEVESIQAVSRIFPTNKWQIVLSDRPHSEAYVCRGSERTSTQQKVAFAVKNSLEVTNVEHLKALSESRDGLRQGLKLTIHDGKKKVHLLNVHLKSGCFVEDYLKSDKEACIVLAKQIKYLDTFLESTQLEQENWLILGDFNHHLNKPNNRFRQDLLHSPGLYNKNAKQSDNLTNLTDGMISCHPKYSIPIDHILVSKAMRSNMTSKSVKFNYFDNMEIDAMLSDHCALSAHFTF